MAMIMTYQRIGYYLHGASDYESRAMMAPSLLHWEIIKHLKTQKEYEELLRDIEKLRAERLQAQQFIAQTMATQQAEAQAKKSQAGQDWNPNMDTAPPRPAPPAPARKLKKVEADGQ